MRSGPTRSILGRSKRPTNTILHLWKLLPQSQKGLAILTRSMLRFILASIAEVAISIWYSIGWLKMVTKEKLIERFKAIPSDFTFDELERLLAIYGFERSNKGKTSGSRVVFKNQSGTPIMLHKPHPGNIVKTYALRQVMDELKNKELI